MLGLPGLILASGSDGILLEHPPRDCMSFVRRMSPRPQLCRFSDADSDDLTTRSDNRRRKSALHCLRVACLRRSWIGSIAVTAQCSHPLSEAETIKSSAELSLIGNTLANGKQAHRCVSHQPLATSALLRVACLRIRGVRAPAKPKFLPPSCPPPSFPELRRVPTLVVRHAETSCEPDWRPDQLRHSAGERGASTACPEPVANGKQLAGVCRIKALWRLHCCALPVCGFGEGERPAQNAELGEMAGK